ncbi:MAG TPA: carboxylating nicotinate-nucleotide diphosphorylase [Aquifex aeolicus]|uniref:Probable nicotinate-nucleotide pyrophosphorylase [carboxylating] n=1 Tax=Aquifex aeolicus TaxID=63363 RepID=A0A9D1CFJ2_AQUAO|nr:carboxylating nicotinate-nucleotide diphosphorylase [Aquifex aeolicus]HIQ26589.1 carboxylating nicotinate-nucleotide diphosphorylase [Aquifex aeolicus]
MNPILVDKLLKEYLLEDIGRVDLSAEGVFRGERVTAVIVAKEEGILAGIPFASRVFRLLGSDIEIKPLKREGDRFKEGETLLVLNGNAKTILMGERLALNILQRLSGIATKTARLVEKIKDLPVRLLDTRKTTPGFRLFEKYAVKVGGGENHRFALYDMVMIKDNHIKVAGSIKEAVYRVRQIIPPFYKVEVEVSNFGQLEEVLELQVDIVMLDNFTPERARQAVSLIKAKKPSLEIEISGGIKEDNVRDFALTGADYLSSGSIIHSARWLDLSLKVV